MTDSHRDSGAVINAEQSYMAKYLDEDGAREVLVEDDGQVGWAYLIENDEIVSDVWLYNCPGQPDDPPWNDPSKQPFPNKKKYIDPTRTIRPLADGDVTCSWDTKGVDLFIDGIRVARLEPSIKPGWSYLVAIDGPAGKRLS